MNLGFGNGVYVPPPPAAATSVPGSDPSRLSFNQPETMRQGFDLLDPADPFSWVIPAVGLGLIWFLFFRKQ